MKNTKRARRAAAFAAAVVMAACAAIPMSSSFSASAEGSISISNTATGHTYEAYQIFDGVLNADKVLSNIEWGTGIDSAKTADLLTAIKAITITTEDGATTPFAACTDAKSVAKVLSDANASFDADITKQFASVVGKFLNPAADGHKESTADAGTYNIDGLDDGYYLVKDKDGSLDNKDDSNTRYIVQVLGNKTGITPKSSKPEVIKKVKENTKAVTATGQTFAGKDNYDVGASYNDVADYCIGDAVPFKLYGTMPDTIDDYSKYKYVFHDTLSKEFTAPDVKDVTVKIGDKVAAGANVTVDSTTNTITVTFDDIKDGNTITKSSIVTVEYTAVLNSEAVVGLNGQENKVYLTYSNNPNWTGEGTPEDNGKTPEDKVIVFTYELDTTKVDGKDNTKLENAKFKLSRKTAAGADEYAKVTDGKLTGWTTTVGEATELVSGTDGLFKVAGLDSGTYYLTETQAPSGYNSLTDPIKVELTATTVNNQTWDEVAASALTELSVKADEVAGTVDTNKGIGSITIANNKGSSLPSTGGIGTTMFYVGGGVLVAGAGVLLITKKRAKKDAE